MRQVDLGGSAVSALGLGCMGMSEAYGAADWDQSTATIRLAVPIGATKNFTTGSTEFLTDHSERSRFSAPRIGSNHCSDHPVRHHEVAPSRHQTEQGPNRRTANPVR
jgi:hypothetical protein